VRRKKGGSQSESTKVNFGRLHQGGHLHDLASQRSIGKKGEWQMTDVYRLHQPQQGVP